MNKAVVLNGLTSAFFGMNSLIITPLVSLFALKYLGATEAELGYVVATFYIMSAVSKIIVGFFVKQKYVFFLQIFGLLLIILSSASYMIAGNMVFLAFLRAIHGIGYGICFAANLTVAAIVAEVEDRSRSINIYLVLSAVGMLVGPLLGTFSTLYFNIPFAFEVASIVSSIGLMFSLYVTKKNYHFSYNDNSPHISWKFIDFLTEKWFIVSVSAYFAYALIYGAIITYVPPYAKQAYGFANYDVTLLFFGFFTFTILSRIILTKESSGRFIKKMLITSLGISVLMLAIIGLIRNPLVFTGSFMLIGITHGFLYPITVLFISNNCKPQQLLRANTLFTTAFDFGNTLGPMLTSTLVVFMPLNLALLGSVILPGLLLIFVANNVRFVEYN